MKSNKDLTIRYEPFGGIIATEEPPACVFVDKDFLLNLNNKRSPLWKGEWNGILSAPIEAHYAITNYCNANCPGCYMSSENKPDLRLDENVSYNRAMKIADSLAEMKIFHVALGGGESFFVPWFLDLADYFRNLGIVPNVTTSGLSISDKQIKRCGVFGQINVSMDDIDDRYKITRPEGSFEKADSTLRRLKENNIRAGINCVISRKNFESLEKIISYARGVGVVDIEFLRFKPVGRGKEIYKEMSLTYEQGIELLPKLKRLARKYRISLKLDCSFTPFICYHRPRKKILEFFAILGCDSGNWLLGVDADGMASPCSFIKGSDIDIAELKSQWGSDDTFSEFRFWDKNTKSFCADCEYLSLCKGGCHAVSHHLLGSFQEPDPECPFVVKGSF